MPPSRIGFLLWVPTSAFIFGSSHFYSRILFLPRLWFQQPLFLYLPVRWLPVLDLSCPTDDQIVYQWPGRECGWRSHVFAQCDSPSCAESGYRNYGAVESGTSPGVWGTSENCVCRIPRKSSAMASFCSRADDAAETDPAERRAGVDFRGKLCALEFSRPSNTPL